MGGESFLGMGGITTKRTGASHLTGKVLLSDGKTPALGAQVLYYPAGSNEPAFMAMTNALGELEPRGLWRGPNISEKGAQTRLSSAVVVALLPGACGATVQTSPVHADEPIRIVLPPPMSVNGEATVGGASPTNRPGTIRVTAAYQDQDSLNSILSVTNTVDASGRFTLAGLTPGTYLVQAALDEIWLSPVITLHVSDGKMLPIHLAIPSPGTAVRVDLRDRSGKPLVNRSITIDRSGPLAYLWPRELVSDPSGAVQIPTMEAGRQTIRVSGESKPVTFRVPALPAAPVVLHLRTTF